MQEKVTESLKKINESPYVIILLAAVNIIIFIITDRIGDTQNALYMEICGGMYPPDIYEQKEYWRFLSSNFLHFGAEHLVNNMVLLCCVGSRVEKVMGHWKTAVVYFLSGICGSVLSYEIMLYKNDIAVSAGASGAVFGLIGALLWAVIRNRGNLEGITTRGMIFMAVLSLYYGFTTAGVDNAGHIGGIFAGFVIAVILYHGKRQKY